MSPKEIRLAACLSLEKAAVGAGVTSPTIRLFEASPEALRPETRRKVANFYKRLAASSRDRASTPPQAA